MKRTGPTNVHMQGLIVELKILSQKEKSGLWKSVAEMLSAPARRRTIVNLSRLNRNTKENETVIVPGKLLGGGFVDHSINVAAFDFSKSAVQKIKSSKGACYSLQDLMKKNPKGKDIKIIG